MELKDKIHTIRDKQVMLDRDLAELYGVETRTLNQAVKRNKERFPEIYMFQLDEEEMKYLDSPDNNLKSQSVTSRW
ncbi:MAG: ORF6N domain-containing protein [Candidatus Woesearchaeota archaeon]